MVKPIQQLYFYLSILLAWPAFAEVTYDDIQKLPPLPASYSDLDFEGRIAWLNTQLSAISDTAEIYRHKRRLFIEYYYQNQMDEAAALCREVEPFRQDIYFRELCIFTNAKEYEDYLPLLMQLVHDAEKMGEPGEAAQVLIDLAWRQSQFGDIAAAFENYEKALAIAPSDDTEMLSTIMMDTATTYIVNGDEYYIRKGIDLLKKAKEQNQQLLEKESDDANRVYLKNNILLADFNSGIAYALHLDDYQKALEMFDRVNTAKSPYQLSALSFSALAAAELGLIDKAKDYLKRAEKLDTDNRSANPVVKTYLECYRQLTTRHWNKQLPASSCLKLAPSTAVEVQLDVYKRLSRSGDASLELAGLRGLKELFNNKIEPQLRRRGSQAASNTELTRLQRESELKSVVLAQQEQIQREREATHAQRQNYFIALFLLMIVVAILIWSQFRQKKKLADQFERMSTVDALTQLGNRRFLEQHIERELSYINRARHTDRNAALGIYIFDVDHFKKINDNYGHRTGDEVLAELSKRVALATRDTDLLVRWGGEEFVYVARLDCNDRAIQLADRILRAVNCQPFYVTEHDPISVTCTIGVVKYPFIKAGNIELWNRLISLADAALYFGKSLQRNCWVIVNNESISAIETIDEVLCNPLSESIDNGLVTVTTSVGSSKPENV